MLALIALAACSNAPTQTATPSDSARDIGALEVTPTASIIPSLASSASATPLGSGSSACRRGDPLANVYHPQRFTIYKTCATVTGIVQIIRRETDGDVHIDVRLDTPYASMIDAKNVSDQHGDLVVEIVPADEAGCILGKPAKPATGTYDYGICTGAAIEVPSIGEHVRVTGPYVLDGTHGWNEIHPAWAIMPAAAPSGGLPPAHASSVSILSVTTPVPAGSQATLAAKTAAHAACTLTVVLPSGRTSTASGLGDATADGNGRVSWTWRIGSNTNPGTATATVNCGRASDRATFKIT